MGKVAEAMKQIKIRSDVPLFLRENGLTRRMCEVGVRHGYNLDQLATVCTGHLIGIDHYNNTGVPGEQDTDLPQEKLDQLYADVVIRNLSDPHVTIMRAKSDAAAAAFPRLWFDFVYIDADHTYEGCKAAMELWWLKLRRGGVFAGHDYIDTRAENGTPFGVVQAVKEFLKQKKVRPENFHHTQTGYRSWFIYKEEGE